MQLKNLSAISCVLLASAVLAAGCKKKDDEENGGSGSGGPASTNADYAGTWNVNETCTSNWTYQMTIAAAGSNSVTITNFHKGTFPNGFTVTGTVSDKTLTIPTQNKTSASQGGPFTFAGSGTLTPPSSLSISYTMKDAGGATISCTASCTK